MTSLVLTLALIGQQVPSVPDRHGEVATPAPVYQGQTAIAPIPARDHVRNEGGSDGAGLCVIASTLANGLYQEVPTLDVDGPDGHRGHGSKYWLTAKSRPGGYGPTKLISLVQELLPGELYGSIVQTDPEVLDKLSREGRPIGATMNTGALYDYKPIHHMISLLHYRSGGWACVRDNNDQAGTYRWMPASEFARRWIDGGTGWAFTWQRNPATPAAQSLPVAWIAAGVVVLAAIVKRGRVA